MSVPDELRRYVPRTDLYDSLELVHYHMPVEQPPATASYIIFKKGNKTYAKNGTYGHIEFEGTDISKVINDVMDALENGGRILIKAGIYYTSTAINLANKTNIIISGEGINATILKISQGSQINAITASGSVNCSITNLTIDGQKNLQTDGGTYSNQCGIFANPSTRLQIYNVMIKNCYYSGIFLRNDTESIIANSYFINNGAGGTGGVQAGVLIDGPSDTAFSERTKVIGCHAEGNYNWGFSVGDYVKYIIFKGCTAKGNNTGFDLEPGTFAGGSIAVIANGCISHSNSYRGFYLNGTRSAIVNSVSYGNVIGIRAEGTLNTIANNLVLTNSQEGMQLSGLKRSTVSGNIIYGNGRTGIWLGACEFVTVCANHLFENGGGSYDTILLTSTSTRNIINGNTIDGNNKSVYGVHEDTSDDDYNIITSNNILNCITAAILTNGANTITANNVT